MIKTISAITILILSSQASYAQKESGGTVGGGDAITGRKIELSKNFVSLKTNLKNFLNELDVSSIKDEAVRCIVTDMKSKGLVDDIEKSPYQLSEQCNVTEKHAASTAIGVRNAPICFDLNEMGIQNTLPGELLGLALHEHAHHFGYRDDADSYRLITAIANIYLEAKLKQIARTIIVYDNPDQLDRNIRAHTTTWVTLYQPFNEIRTNFMDSGAIKLSSLPIMQSGIESGTLQFSALTIFTNMFDEVLVNGRGAKRNKLGIDYAVLIASILKEGANSDKNIRWFADQMDNLYTFWGEGK